MNLTPTSALILLLLSTHPEGQTWRELKASFVEREIVSQGALGNNLILLQDSGYVRSTGNRRKRRFFATPFSNQALLFHDIQGFVADPTSKCLQVGADLLFFEGRYLDDVKEIVSDQEILWDLVLVQLKIQRRLERAVLEAFPAERPEYERYRGARWRILNETMKASGAYRIMSKEPNSGSAQWRTWFRKWFEGVTDPILCGAFSPEQFEGLVQGFEGIIVEAGIPDTRDATVIASARAILNDRKARAAFGKTWKRIADTKCVLVHPVTGFNKNYDLERREIAEKAAHIPPFDALLQHLRMRDYA